MERDYNFIYNKLVNGKYDIRGHIAYSLYKADKQEFIRDFKKRSNDSVLKESDLTSFHNISCLESTLEKYQLTANIILQQFLDETLNESIKEIEKDCVNNQKQLLSEVVDPIKPPKKWSQFFLGVGTSIVGAFIFAMLLAAFGFINLFKVGDISVTYDLKNKSTETSLTVPTDSLNLKK